MIREWKSRIDQLQQRVDAARHFYELFAETFQVKRKD
jgi:hypothetical protein